jgi:Spy/CpxP family protein refolding chaperone
MINKYKLWIVLSLLTAFAAGLLGGIFWERYYFHRKRHASMARTQRTEGRPPDIQEMARDLGLSVEQQDQVKKIFESNDVRLKELRAEMHNRLSGIRSEIKSQIDAVLTPEQKSKFESIIAKHRERAKKESEQRRIDRGRENSPDKPKGEVK